MYFITAFPHRSHRRIHQRKISEKLAHPKRQNITVNELVAKTAETYVSKLVYRYTQHAELTA